MDVRRSPIFESLLSLRWQVLGISLSLLAGTAAFAAADPINHKTTTFTARCTGLGEVTAVAVFFPSALARGATSAFHIVGTNTILIWYTTGTNRLAEQAGTDCEVTSINGEPASGEVATFISGGPVGIWNPAVDWHNSPDQANPSPDSQGHPGVWRYMASFGFEREPSTYQLLPNYQPAGEQWNDPAYVNLLVEHSFPTSPELHMHSYGGRVGSFGRNSIVAWTSPVNGRIRIDGSLQLPDVSECSLGSGIIWSIQQEAATIFEAAVAAGEGATFALAANVRKGETLYFMHDPGWDSNCDFAAVRLQITKP